MVPGGPASNLSRKNVIFGPAFDSSGFLTAALWMRDCEERRKRKSPAANIEFVHDKNVDFLYSDYFKPRRAARSKKHYRIELKASSDLFLFAVLMKISIETEIQIFTFDMIPERNQSK